MEAEIASDNEELRELLDQVHTIQRRRAHRKGLIHWLREMPGTYQPITYTNSGVTEDVARNVLLGSTQPEVVDPDEGTVRLVG